MAALARMMLRDHLDTAMIDEMLAQPRAVSPRELIADGIVHALGVGLGVPAAIVLVSLVALDGRAAVGIVPVAVYAAGLVAMLACSAAYNVFRRSRRSAWLRRFDHAAIFAMIAGTYTPFTVLRLDGAWATGLTGAIWSIAGLGIGAKLLQPRWIERISLALYLVLGWIGLIAIGPFMQAMDGPTLGLLAAGGLLYTAGVVFHVWRALPFHTAIWHGFVLVAAGLHYGAVLSMLMD
jgi:hemolysin III